MKRKIDDEDDLYTDLTEKQEKVLDYIEDCIQAGLPPTRAEIAAHFEFSPQNATQYVNALVKHGRIEVLPDRSRGIKLLSLYDDLDR